MDSIIKISLLGIIGALFGIQFKATKPEYSLLIGIGIGMILFGYALNQVSGLVNVFQSLKQYIGSGGAYLGVLLKVIGITYICEFSSGICKDAGFGVLADQIEIMGKLSVIFAGIPILLAVVEQIQSLA